jgi:choline dehydrogenase-like flavoprotein
MIVDFDCLSGSAVAPVVIIGSGPAGITLALRLTERGVASLLLEAGGERFSADSQDVYAGRVVGDDYYALDVTRLRFFGGSSNHWEGWCRPLDAHDFEPRDDFPIYGWPISKADLDPYSAAADAILQTHPVRERAVGADLVEAEFTYSPPVNFAEKYRSFFAASDKAHILFDAPVQSLLAESGRVTAARVMRPDGTIMDVRGHMFVLCTGGIENSRLLLWSNEDSPEPVVPAPETLGRYWMEHPHNYAGQAELSGSFLEYKSPRSNQFFLAPSYASMRRHGILNGTVRVWPTYYGESLPKDTLKRTICLFGTASEEAMRRLGKSVACVPEIQIVWEQEPRYENAVTLDPEAKDRFGVPRPVLHWRKSPVDYRTPKVIFELFGRFVVSNGLGRVRAYEHLVREGDHPTDGWMGGHHHMGGTRMADSPADGVVDANLRVFGMSNCYVAGSSVFPTSGHANPTFTIVQLSLRLADHLSETLYSLPPQNAAATTTAKFAATTSRLTPASAVKTIG